MTTELAAQPPMSRTRLIEVLGSSLYPGAKPASIEMVLDYCLAAKLDPLQKPVHIVPMGRYVSEPQEGNKPPKKVWRDADTIMPGIGLYRTQAARTGCYAGKGKPVWGPTQTLKFKRKVEEWSGNGPDATKTTKLVDETVEYPEWCEVTVYRITMGQRCDFTCQEFWLENYATAGKGSDAPNAMWTKRAFAQLAKCAEAQALRSGFPEIGAAPTADETIINEFDDTPHLPPPVMPSRASDKGTVIDSDTGEITSGATATTTGAPDDTRTTTVGDTRSAEQAGDSHKAFIRGKIARVKLTEEAVAALLKRHGATSIDTLTMKQFDDIRVELLNA